MTRLYQIDCYTKWDILSLSNDWLNLRNNQNKYYI